MDIQEKSAIGPMSMIKIDGVKIKLIREQQGLTQLYIATAVQVTTDTISRWENRRYPSIKHENALKLAEALDVELQEILLIEEESNIQPSEDEVPFSSTSPPPKKSHNRSLLIASCLLLIITLGTLFFFFSKHSATPVPATFVARRILPEQCSPNSQCPIIIEVDSGPETSGAVIVSEQFPAQAVLMKTSPLVTAHNSDDHHLKWLKKIHGIKRFAYTVRINAKLDDHVHFLGKIAASSGEQQSPVMISGNTEMVIKKFHWADRDRDNTISDREILAVYDQYSDLEGLDLDIDQIEEIWLGSGYLIDTTTGIIHVIE